MAAEGRHIRVGETSNDLSNDSRGQQRQRSHEPIGTAGAVRRA